MRDHNGLFTKLGVDSLLYPSDEDCVTEEVSLSRLVSSTTSTNVCEKEKELDEEAEGHVRLYSVKEHLPFLATTIAILVRECTFYKEAKNFIVDRQQAFRLEKQVNLRQKSNLNRFGEVTL